MATPAEETIAAPIQDKMATPVEEPTATLVEEPTAALVEEPTAALVEEPTAALVEEPTAALVEEPTATPVEEPTATSVEEPTATSVEEPTATSVEEPTAAPAEKLTAAPAEEPTAAPVEEHTAAPVEEHTAPPVEEHTAPPVEEHTAAPIEGHTAAPVEEHTVAPVEEHTATPVEEQMVALVEEPMSTPVEEAMVAPVEEVMATHYEEAMAAHFEDSMTAHFEEPMTTPINHKRATPDEDMMETPDEEKMLTLTTYENNEVENTETQPNKRRKKKSIVWEHFTIENVSPGCRRACCKQCKQSFAYSTGSKVAGTSHLKRHIAKGTCPALLRNQNNNQSSPYTPATRGGSSSNPPKRRYRTPNTPQIIFDPDRCRHEIARMIIMHDYPLHMVEHPGFVAFTQNLNPRFNMVSFNTVQGDCVATYLMEKQSVTKFIEGIPGRVCLTLDMWTSSQSVGYVFVTGHFIDADWKLHRRLLNVVMEPYPDSDSALSHAVAVCLHDWSLENKLFSVTYDQPLGETALENLRPLLSNKNPLILNGQLLVGHCIARTLSSIAKEVLAAGSDVVKKVRDSVKYVKTSESHEEKFLELKSRLQVPSERSLSIDDQTKWNTTYQMLVACYELKEVFSCLDTSDPDYKQAPSMEDWKQVETICTFLKLIFDAANILTTTTNPTPVTFFHEVWRIQTDLTKTVASEDPFISSLTKTMQERIEKYWKNCSLALATAVVMDPRFKMKLVEFSFNKVYGEEAPTYIKVVDDGIHELFHEYLTLPLPLTPTYADEGNNYMKTEDSQGGANLTDNGLTDFDMYIMETTSQQMKSELDQYLDESLLPRVHDFDVLGWWKLNKMKYPTLSKMARDILSIPVSTVPSDSVFDTTVKEMDQYRTSLRPETVEALICAKDWMQYGSADASTALVRMEY